MKNIQYTNSLGNPRRGMEEEFLSHRQGLEWWYSTGYFTDEAENLYSYQFTLARLKVYGIKLHFLITALTDFKTGKHHYGQQAVFFGKNIIITPARVGVDGVSEMTFSEKKLGLETKASDYSLKLDLGVAKPPVWHCDDGILKMGIEDQWTYYFSYTNLALSGKMVLDGKEHAVKGKGWFDKQGGTYKFLDTRTSWEWFSMRFFDNEEAMLFSFPQDDYRDGTFIDKSGKRSRLKDYTIAPLGFIEAEGMKFSDGWKVRMNGVKDQDYTIVPKIKGQFNLFFFELLADIVDKNGKVAGYCFVELLPGAYNKKSPVSSLFKKVK